MNETAPPPEPSVLPALVLAPLAVESLTPAVQKLMAAPSSGKLMALRGIAALRPVELVTAVYQLSFDADAAVKAAAAEAPGTLPDKVLVAPLSEPLPALVLHFFGQRIAPHRIEVVERILYNGATSDETFVVLAGRLNERELEVIISNEIRLLRCPAIVSALFMNKQARMSSVNRAIELCARNKVRVDGIPSFDEVVKAISEDPSSTDPTAVDMAFRDVLEVSATVPEGDDDDDDDEAGEAGERGEKKKKESSRKSPVIDFTRLKLYEKIRLATLGNAYCRSNLIRDSNKMVSMAVIRSPMITDSEVVRAAGNRQVAEEVIRYIANQREFTKMYPVKIALVHNPKCPLAFSLRFLPMLHGEDLKTLARSKNIPSALALAARKLIQTRTKNA
jgi:hypothetical protein